MKNNKISLNLLIDVSGSMAKIQDEATSTIINYLKSQKEHKNKEIELSIYEFSSFLTTKIENLNINEYNESNYVLIPTGMTALYDALGTVINKKGDYFSSLNESERPEKVLLIVLTDGEENNSKLFTLDKVKGMITHQESKYNWSFLFLGANLDVQKTAHKTGFRQKMSASWIQDSAGVERLGKVLNAYSSRYMTTNGVVELSKDEKDYLAGYKNSI